jgi:hypothetical protein
MENCARGRTQVKFARFLVVISQFLGAKKKNVCVEISNQHDSSDAVGTKSRLIHCRTYNVNPIAH